MAETVSAVAVAAGGEHTVAVSTTGEVVVVGSCGAGWNFDFPYNSETLLATAARCRALPPLLQRNAQEDGAFAAKIFAGSFHNLLIAGARGRLFSWGCGSIDENDGQLGTGFRTEISTPVRVMDDVVDAAAGAHHSLAVTSDGKLLSCGAGLLGQLGRDHDYNCDTDTPYAHGPSHAAFAPVNLPTDSGEKAVSCGAGYYHSLAVTGRGRVFCFGSNSHGQCGVPPSDAEEVFAAPRCTDSLKNVQKAVGGYGHTVAMTHTGDVWTCGGNLRGQRGIPGEDGDIPVCTRIDVGGPAADIAAGYSHTVVLRRDGHVVAFGENDFGQLGLPGESCATPQEVPTGGRCVQVSAGGRHTVALRADGKVLSWGSGSNGQQSTRGLSDIDKPMLLVE